MLVRASKAVVMWDHPARALAARLCVKTAVSDLAVCWKDRELSAVLSSHTRTRGPWKGSLKSWTVVIMPLCPWAPAPPSCTVKTRNPAARPSVIKHK